MHYLDKKHLKKNILKVIIYVHQNHNNPDDRSFLKITSIRKCKYISDIALGNLLKNQNNILKSLCIDEKLKFEKYYLLTINQTGWKDFSLKKCKIVKKKSDNSFFYLH